MTGDLSGSKNWLFIIGGFHPQRLQFQRDLLERLDADDLLLLELLYKQAMDVAVHFEQIVRLAKEVRAFKSFNAYVHAVEIVGSVSRQNEG